MCSNLFQCVSESGSPMDKPIVENYKAMAAIVTQSPENMVQMPVTSVKTSKHQTVTTATLFC